jgi:type VII secretion protein EccE
MANTATTRGSNQGGPGSGGGPERHGSPRSARSAGPRQGGPGQPRGSQQGPQRGAGASGPQGAPGGRLARRGPIQAQPIFEPRPGRIGPIPLVRLVLLEIAAAAVLIPVLTKHMVWIVYGGPVAVVALIGVVAGGSLFGPRSLARSEFRERHGQKARNSAAVAPAGEAALAPLRETFPTLRTTGATGRGGEQVGMVGDGTFLTAVVLADARQAPLRAPRTANPLPLSAIAGVLYDDKLPVAGVQVVIHTLPAPAPTLQPHALAVRSYMGIVGDVPAQRTAWVAVRLDPAEATAAIEARGGGSAGAAKTLMTAAQRVASDLQGAGFNSSLLNEGDLIAALGTACSVNPNVGTVPNAAGRPQRTEETRRAWRCDDRWHTTYWVDRLPKLDAETTPALVATLTSTPAFASTLAMSVTRGIGSAIGFSMHLRVTARSETQLGEAAKAVEQLADKAGVGLTRLDGEQLPGLIATIPLGGEA